MRKSVIVLLIAAFLAGCAGSAKDLDSQFLKAAEEGNLKTVQSLLSQGVDVNVPDEYGRTALMLAAYNGQVAVVRSLLDAGADVNAKGRYGATAAVFAERGGHQEIFEMLRAATPEPA